MNDELVKFAGTVRESTLKRLKLVPVGAENWRVDPEAMSFSDTAQHLIESDQWLHSTLKARTSAQMLGRAGIANITDRTQYEALLNKLVRSGHQRASLLSSLTRRRLVCCRLQWCEGRRHALPPHRPRQESRTTRRGSDQQRHGSSRNVVFRLTLQPITGQERILRR